MLFNDKLSLLIHTNRLVMRLNYSLEECELINDPFLCMYGMLEDL